MIVYFGLRDVWSKHHTQQEKPKMLALLTWHISDTYLHPLVTRPRILNSKSSQVKSTSPQERPCRRRTGFYSEPPVSLATWPAVPCQSPGSSRTQSPPGGRSERMGPKTELHGRVRQTSPTTCESAIFFGYVVVKKLTQANTTVTRY